MCYKYATPKLEELLDHLKEQPPYTVEDYFEYYLADGFAHQYMPITTVERPRIISKAIWGLVPQWVTEPKQAKEFADKTLNAKSETIYERPSYKNYIGSKRCLIWTNGFFEHQWLDSKGKNKQPYFIYMNDKKPFCFGGIYSEYLNPATGELLNTFSIVTTEANTLMAEIHNNKKRMPLILTSATRESWISNLNKQQIQDLMQPLDDGELQAHRISKLITSRTEDRNVPEVQVEVPSDTLF